MKTSPLLIILIMLCFTPSAWAFRCGNKVINEQSYQLEVLEYCGEPSHIIERPQLRTRRLSLASLGENRPDNYVIVGDQIELTEEVRVEEWIYNFGKRKLSQKIYFEDGMIIKIKSLGYGF